MTGSSFFRSKLFPIYCELNLLKLSNIYKLEVLKFVYKFRATLLPSSFADYFHSAPEIHNMPTRFSKSYNLALPTFYTSGAQRSIPGVCNPRPAGHNPALQASQCGPRRWQDKNFFFKSIYLAICTVYNTRVVFSIL